jgi:hypothetical protein
LLAARHRVGRPNGLLAIDERLRTALNDSVGRANGSDNRKCWWWAGPYRYWNSIDVLEKLATSGNEPVTYIAEHLELMARTVEQVIEQEISTRSAASSGSQ